MSTLRLVSLENTQLNSETRDLLVKRGCEDETKPFIVISSSNGLRRVDISLNDAIDWAIMDFLNKIPYTRGENPIQELSFAKGFALSEADFIREESRQAPQGLLRLEKFQIQNLNLTGVDAEVSIFHHLAKTWPLQKLLLDDAEVIIKGSNPQDLPQAIKITINLIKRPSPSLKAFLNSFSRIGAIEINHGQHLIEEDSEYLDELIAAKNVEVHSINIDPEVAVI